LIALIKHPGCFNIEDYHSEIEYLMTHLSWLVGQGRTNYMHPAFFSRIANVYIQRVVVQQDSQLLRAQKVFRTVDQHTFVTQATMIMHALNCSDSYDPEYNKKMLRTLSYLMLRVEGQKPLYLTNYNSTLAVMHFNASAKPDNQTVFMQLHHNHDHDSHFTHHFHHHHDTNISISDTHKLNASNIVVTAANVDLNSTGHGPEAPLTGQVFLRMFSYQDEEDGSRTFTPISDEQMPKVQIHFGGINQAEGKQLACAGRDTEEDAWMPVSYRSEGGSHVCEVTKGHLFSIVEGKVMNLHTKFGIVLALVTVATAAVLYYLRKAQVRNSKIQEFPMYERQDLDRPLLNSPAAEFSTISSDGFEDVDFMDNGRRVRNL